MDALRQMWRYVGDNQAFFVESLRIHLQLSGVALGIAILLCVPLGIWLARRLTLATPVINLVSALRVIPSLAILFLAIPYLGLNRTAAFVALTLLALPPVLINSYAAFRGVPAAVKEAARGMGMNTWQLLWQIELPLALPVVMTGIRTAAVEVISSAALATFIGAGGLGDFIARGFRLSSTPIMLVGAIPIALLALSSELLLGGLQRRLSAHLVR
ncbi:MAG: ABC transporter permease [Ardenticatenales bacterium]|nr:ABC transporter permease [Ardenticatenales bacterium]